MNQISKVVLYLTDLTPQNFLEGSIVGIPKVLIPNADAQCNLNGELIDKYSTIASFKNRWLPKMSDNEWQRFFMEEFPGQEVRVYQAQTKHVQYTLGIVMRE